MKLSAEGRKLIESWEGRRATAYRDTANRWTVGIGHLIRPDEEWMKTRPLTDAEIDEVFAKDVAWAERAVSRVFEKVKLRQNQFDALVSFTYNVGEGNLMRGTLDNLILEGASPEAISAKWMEYVRSGGHVTRGLVFRRTAEVKYYWQHLWRIASVLLIIAAGTALVSAALLART